MPGLTLTTTTTTSGLTHALAAMQGIEDSGPFDGNGLQWLLDMLVSAFGGAGMLGLILSGVIFLAFYIATNGDLATPTVALILIGTVTVPMLPASYEQLAYAIVLMGLAAALWQVIKTYVLTPT